MFKLIHQLRMFHNRHYDCPTHISLFPSLYIWVHNLYNQYQFQFTSISLLNISPLQNGVVLTNNNNMQTLRVAAVVVATLIVVWSCDVNGEMSEISCSEVAKQIGPCANYLKEGTKPSQVCCNGVKYLDGNVKSKQDRVAVCNCVKNALSDMGKYDPNRIAQLPKQCGLNINLPPVDGNTDCNK